MSSIKLLKVISHENGELIEYLITLFLNWLEASLSFDRRRDVALLDICSYYFASLEHAKVLNLCWCWCVTGHDPLTTWTEGSVSCKLKNLNWMFCENKKLLTNWSRLCSSFIPQQCTPTRAAELKAEWDTPTSSMKIFQTKRSLE